MTRRQQIAEMLRELDNRRGTRIYVWRIALAGKLMPGHFRLATFILWASLEEAKLQALIDESQRLVNEQRHLLEPSEDRIVVPIDYLQRFM